MGQEPKAEGTAPASGNFCWSVWQGTDCTCQPAYDGSRHCPFPRTLALEGVALAIYTKGMAFPPLRKCPAAAGSVYAHRKQPRNRVSDGDHSKLPVPAIAWIWQNSRFVYCPLSCPGQAAPEQCPQQPHDFLHGDTSKNVRVWPDYGVRSFQKMKICGHFLGTVVNLIQHIEII